MLPGWKDLNLQRQADEIQANARTQELIARSILTDLDQAFADLEKGKPKVRISAKISELEYQITALEARFPQVEGLLASNPPPSVWDSAFLRGLRNSIGKVREELLVNLVYFERQYEHNRLKLRVSPKHP